MQQASLGARSNDPSASADQEPRANSVVIQYLLENIHEFRELSRLRQMVSQLPSPTIQSQMLTTSKGWENPAGDHYFRWQRRTADAPTSQTRAYFYKIMVRIGEEMHRTTGVFQINSTSNESQSILDMCMAPGGFLAFALEVNPEADVLCFSLPESQGGHEVLLPERPNVTLKYLDINMLAEDLGVSHIPGGHPDANNFLPKQLKQGQAFDLVLCDGQVLRTHNRAHYREHREARRLALTQLALGLEHVKPGGTIIMLLHKVKAWETVYLLYKVSKFSSIKLFKSRTAHAKRSSFYMLCTEIKSNHPEATDTIVRWKKEWAAATFGTDEEYKDVLLAKEAHAEQIRD